MTAIAGQRLQLAFLALEAAAERVADQRGGARARRHRQQRTIIGGGLMRQQGQRIGQIAPAQRLLVQREDVGFGSPRDRRDQVVDIGRVALAAKSRSHSAMLKVECLPPMKLAQRAP